MGLKGSEKSPVIVFYIGYKGLLC